MLRPSAPRQLICNLHVQDITTCVRRAISACALSTCKMTMYPMAHALSFIATCCCLCIIRTYPQIRHFISLRVYARTSTCKMNFRTDPNEGLIDAQPHPLAVFIFTGKGLFSCTHKIGLPGKTEVAGKV